MDNELFDKHLVTVLLNRTAAKGSAITYGELAAQIKSGYGYEVNPHLGFSNALGRLQKTCSELDFALYFCDGGQPAMEAWCRLHPVLP